MCRLRVQSSASKASGGGDAISVRHARKVRENKQRSRRRRNPTYIFSRHSTAANATALHAAAAAAAAADDGAHRHRTGRSPRHGGGRHSPPLQLQLQLQSPPARTSDMHPASTHRSSAAGVCLPGVQDVRDFGSFPSGGCNPIRADGGGGRKGRCSRRRRRMVCVAVECGWKEIGGPKRQPIHPSIHPSHPIPVAPRTVRNSSAGPELLPPSAFLPSYQTSTCPYSFLLPSILLLLLLRFFVLFFFSSSTTALPCFRALPLLLLYLHT